MEINLVETWHAMNNLVRGVVIVLTLQALACISVAVDRLLMLALAYRKGRRFARGVGPLLSSGDYQGAVELAAARKHKSSHLAGLIRLGVETFLKNRQKGHDGGKSAELAGRALDRKSESLSAALHRGMNVLASTGSTAPFIGLLGTVLGILNAFKLVGKEGSGGLGTIGVAIAEALIVTGYGLMVAIPSVLLYNWLSARLASYEAGLAHAKSELVDALESGSAPRRAASLVESGDPDTDAELAGMPLAAAPVAATVQRRSF
jgi:biopolymer transport protein ExbB/TolQ